MKWTSMDNLVYRNDKNEMCIYKSALLQIANKVENENNDVVISELRRLLGMLQKGIEIH